jgi:hypothetical protein
VAERGLSGVFGQSLNRSERPCGCNKKPTESVNGEAKVSAAERYLAGGLALHFHYRERRSKTVVESNPRDFCAIFYALDRFAPSGLGGMFDQVSLGVDRAMPKSDGRDIEVDVEAVDDAVLVNVPEAVEVAEAVRNVPSLVRLQLLQDCDGVFIQKTQHAMCLEPAGVMGDGEGDLPSGTWLPEFLDRVRAACEKPRRLVESGPSVVNNVANHEAQSEMVRGRVGLGGAKAQDVTSGLVIELIDNAKRLRLNPSFALMVESFQLLDCPIELGSRSQ